jgi:hypothetical protein
MLGPATLEGLIGCGADEAAPCATAGDTTNSSNLRGRAGGGRVLIEETDRAAASPNKTHAS